jgi:hypothetical protein
MTSLLLVTPALGALKNYVKYKQFDIMTNVRTPFAYVLLQLLFQTNNIWKIITLERWLFFAIKIIRSIWRNDYMRNQVKYENKYGIDYQVD